MRGDKSTQTPVGDETSSQTPVRNETSSQTPVRADHDTGSNHTITDDTPVQQPDAADNVKSTEQIYASQLDEYKHKHQQRRLQANEQQNIHPGYTSITTTAATIAIKGLHPNNPTNFIQAKDSKLL